MSQYRIPKPEHPWQQPELDDGTRRKLFRLLARTTPKKGQTARSLHDAQVMALALLYPDVSKEALQRARTIARESPELAEAVLEGKAYLKTAYAETRSS